MSDKKSADEAVTSTRPYLLRAIHQWAVDNDFTPQVLIDADHQGVQVPMNYVQDGTIVLNTHPRAVKRLTLDNDHLSFSTRFGGQPFEIFAPMSSVLAIFARENGQGIFFEAEDGGGEPSGPDTPSETKVDKKKSNGEAESGDKRSHLKLVK